MVIILCVQPPNMGTFYGFYQLKRVLREKLQSLRNCIHESFGDVERVKFLGNQVMTQHPSNNEIFRGFVGQLGILQNFYLDSEKKPCFILSLLDVSICCSSSSLEYLQFVKIGQRIIRTKFLLGYVPIFMLIHPQVWFSNLFRTGPF